MSKYVADLWVNPVGNLGPARQGGTSNCNTIVSDET